MLSRAELLRSLVITAAAAAVPASAQTVPAADVTIADLKSFAKLAGLTFTDAEYAEILKSVRTQPTEIANLRKTELSNGDVPPEAYRVPGAEKFKATKVNVKASPVKLKRPAKDEDIAFLTVAELSHLLQSFQISSEELAKIYLKRLKQHGPKLLNLVTLCEDSALKEAKAADMRLRTRRVHHPLLGIPYGIKDLFATKGYPTQWGTAAYKGQTLDQDAAVVEKLREVGAVLVAKLSLGALAMNDNWFAGRTLNPWNLEEGSSGSSAGSASAMAAGLVAFAIGTETSGSIVSPCQRCRVTGLRPTFGSVSRHGGMCLSWSMDKVGPICRTAEDALLVLSALVGQDERDASSIHRELSYAPRKDLKGWKVGVFGSPVAEAVELLRAAGAETVPFTVPPTPAGLDNIISVEAATMFDDLTRSEKFALLTENEWPEYFRAARFVPAVEYARANRARTLLIRRWAEALRGLDVVLAPAHSVATIYNTNLTGHPQLFVPFRPQSVNYTSVSFLANWFDEAKMVAAAKLLQEKTEFFRLRPPTFG